MDAGFDPDVTDPGSASVRSLLIQEDGKILVGGDFDTVGSESRDNFARLTAGSQAEQSMQIDQNGQTVSWHREGAGPEILEARFIVQFLDDLSLLDLGLATRQAGAWVINNANLPSERPFTVQAQAYYGTGTSGRGSVLAVSKLFSLPLDDPLCFPVVAANGNIAGFCL